MNRLILPKSPRLHSHALPERELGDPFVVRNEKVSASRVVELLQPFATQERWEKIQQVVGARSRHFVPVTEGLYDLGNVNAVMRTAEALGFLDFHRIDNATHQKSANRVSQGADKWLMRYLWRDTASCFSYLKEKGYQIGVTHLSQDAVSLDEVDFSKPTAIVFGNEHQGITDKALGLADFNVRIPMVGFTQSFNISVAGALTLFAARAGLSARSVGFADLDDAERDSLQAEYLFRSIDHPELILARRLKELR